MKQYTFLALFVLFVQTISAESILNLDSCRAMALHNNRSLQISRKNIESATLSKKVASTKYLPELSASGAYLWNQKNISLLESDKFLPIGSIMGNGTFGFRPEQISNQWTILNGTPVPLDGNGKPFNPSTNPELIQWKDYTTIPKEQFEVDIHNIFVGMLTISQPIYMGGKIRAYNKITRYAEELAHSQYDLEEQELILQTDQTYWQIVALAYKKKLAEKYVELLTKLHHDVQEMINEGVATQADGLAVNVKLNEAEMTLLKVEDGLTLSRMKLCQLCGLDFDYPLQLADETTENISTVTLKEEKNILDIYDQRPEIKMLSLMTKISQQKEKIALSEHLPTVALMANYMTSNPSMFNGIRNKFDGEFNVGVVVKIPLFHFGEAVYQHKIAKLATETSRLKLDETKENIELQYNQAVFKQKEAQVKLQKTVTNMAKAEENLRIATLGFAEGIIPTSNVLEAQTAWLSANSEKIDAQIDVKMAETYLNKVTGQLRMK